MNHDELKQQIPDDLKLMYSVMGMVTGSSLAPISKDGVKGLIERIAELEAKLAQARKEALEEAAKRCISVSHTPGLTIFETGKWYAKKILALIAKETP